MRLPVLRVTYPMVAAAGATLRKTKLRTMSLSFGMQPAQEKRLGREHHRRIEISHNNK